MTGWGSDDQKESVMKSHEECLYGRVYKLELEVLSLKEKLRESQEECAALKDRQSKPDELSEDTLDKTKASPETINKFNKPYPPPKECLDRATEYTEINRRKINTLF
jgi:hypothetical protein